MKTVLIYTQMFLVSLCFSQKNDSFFFPIFKLNENQHIERNSFDSAYIDSIKFGNSYIRFINQKAYLRGVHHEDYSFGTFTQQVDTVILDNEIVVIINPFPNVYYYTETIEDSTNIIRGSNNIPLNLPNPVVIHGEPHISFYKNGNLKSICLFNNSYGTVKAFFSESGRIIAQGAFFKNKKNGQWCHFDESGKVMLIEIFDRGVRIG